MQRARILDLVVFPAVGCEKFAELGMCMPQGWLESQGMNSRVRVRSVEVREHGANSGQVIA